MQHIGRKLLIQHGIRQFFLQRSDENFESEGHVQPQFQLGLSVATGSVIHLILEVVIQRPNQDNFCRDSFTTLPAIPAFVLLCLFLIT